MKILIAGLGSIGQRHVRNLRALLGSGVEIIAYRARGQTHALTDRIIVDPQSNVAREYGIRAYRDFGEALAQDPDAVLICNPTSLHIPLALLAAEAGCHLFIEKPVSHSLDGLTRLATVVREKRLAVLVGFQFRFHPGLRVVKQIIDDGGIGPVIHVQAHWGEALMNWHPGEDYRQSYSARADLGGGVLLTLSHPLDYLRWLFGEVDLVSAITEQVSGLDLDVEDVADIHLKFKSGVLATVHLDYIEQPGSHVLQITGRGGTIRFDNRDGAVHCFRSEHGSWETFPAPDGFQRNTMFVEEMRHFVACLNHQAEPLVTLTDGTKNVELVLAAKRAAACGYAVNIEHHGHDRTLRSA
jgi:predicted dehydrogenase